MPRDVIRDDQWDRIKDILPGDVGHVGVAARDKRVSRRNDGFYIPEQEVGKLVTWSARTSFLPALRQRAGGEIRSCPGQAAVAVPEVRLSGHAGA